MVVHRKWPLSLLQQHATRLGHAEIVARLVTDIDVEETDNDGWTALLNAAHQGHAPVARALLAAGASVDNPDLMGWTSLMWACYKNRPEVVDVLREFKAHINIVGEEDGLTPLIIASGRGFTEVVKRLLVAGAQGFTQIVEQLLNSGAELDAVGMYGSTALMLATRGNHVQVVELLLTREPNVNVVDYNGLSALGIASREGYTEIASMLLQSRAFVNTVDRFGNSILASAVRSGNIRLVRMLLEKHADVNAKDSEGRTPLHLAIDKSYSDVLLALLEKKPNLELKNWDGDTALIRAVKNKDAQIVQLLVNMCSKLSATDNAGDNALHLALRSRSRRLAQVLLVNPADSKLLYRPNKLGETPYSIDQESGSPILPTIFGPIGNDAGLKSLFGFDSYGDVLADVVCEPNLALPLTIGLYAKWGSGKSLLLPRIRDSMSSFSRTWLDGVELYWSWTLVLFVLLSSAFLSLLICALASLLVRRPHFLISSGVGIGVFTLFVAVYGFIYYGSEVKLWNGSIASARLIGRTIARFKLMLSVLFLNSPVRRERSRKMISPVSFLFADDHRLSFIGGEHSLANILQSFFTAAEEHYGTLAVHLFTTLRSSSAERSSKFQSFCGVPVLVLTLAFPCSLAAASFLFIQTRHWLASVFLAMSLISGAFILYIFSVRIFINLPKRRITQISDRLHLIPFERMIQKLQKEVDLLVSLVCTLDEFTSSQTRLVIMVDGLDSCESNKMVQMLDALSLFFCSRQNAPFIVLLAVDPNIVVSTIQQNLRTAAGPEGGITGRDYLKNIVTMPFFLDHMAAIRKTLPSQQNSKKMTLLSNSTAGISLRERKRSETFRGSKLSLRAEKGGDVGNLSGGAFGGPGDISHLLPSFDLFVNINPRTMRRIVNSIALNGRLLRMFEIEFSWWQVYAWCSLIEQWPWRMCWIIDIALSLQEESMPIHELYAQIKNRITVAEGMGDLDRNGQEFEPVFRKLCASRSDQLLVAHVKAFVPCTSNLDPYLRKTIREQRGGEPIIDLSESQEDGEGQDPFGPLKETIGPEAEFVFQDPMVWASVRKPLAKMPVAEVVALVRHLGIVKEREAELVKTFCESNLNGLVLQICDLNELKQILKMPLGDWTIIKLLIESLRKWKPFSTQSLSTPPDTNTNSVADVVQPQNYQQKRLEDSQQNDRVALLRSIQEEDGSVLRPLLAGNGLMNGDEPGSGDGVVDEEEMNSLASVAGSDQRSLLKSSSSPPRD
uniref:ANK_REP_REGION domain-containing protein n=1 Tax=Globodera pallida TaxID=36090 RepID=A0A183C2G0_GLOPA